MTHPKHIGRLMDGEYFRRHVDIDTLDDPGCWEWKGSRLKGGYAHAHRPHRRILAHRFAYELLVGPIPQGLHLDHLCRNRACVNPAHLEPVSARENILRGTSMCAANAKKTHCKRGHPYDEKNTYINPNGARSCRVCLLGAQKRYIARQGMEQ